MHPEEFRRHAHALVDWMADYMENVAGCDRAGASDDGLAGTDDRSVTGVYRSHSGHRIDGHAGCTTFGPGARCDTRRLSLSIGRCAPDRLCLGRGTLIGQ